MNPFQVQAENRIWALVAYALAPVGSIIALLLAGDDLALKGHAKQGLLAGIAGAVVFTVLGFIPLLSSIGMLLSIAFWMYLITCGVRAYQGQEVSIPFISNMEV